MNNIATNLRNIRTERGLSQTEIADLLGTTQQQYSKYEQGVHEVPTRHIITLCEFYGVKADELLGINMKHSVKIQENLDALKEFKYISSLSFSSYHEFLSIIIKEKKVADIRNHLGMHIAYMLVCEMTGEKLNTDFYLNLCENNIIE